MATGRAEAAGHGAGGRPAVQIAVLAKAPIAGWAKTRLIPALGADGAARLQRRLTLRTLATARAAALGPTTLWCAPDPDHRFFRALRRFAAIACLPQPPGDLGARMLAAFEWHCRRGPTLLVGTDCPALSPAHLQGAARALQQGHDAAILPATDGGYVLIGLREPQPCLFDAMAWGADTVTTCTRARARSARLRLHEGPLLWDLDVPADLQRLSRAVAAGLGLRDRGVREPW